MNNSNFFKKIFIVGCPRSGTTLLQKLLLSVPGSYSMPETNFFQLLPNNYYVAQRSLPQFMKFRYPNYVSSKTLDRILNFMKKNVNLNFSLATEKKLYQQASDKSLSVDYFFDKLIQSYASIQNYIMIEKTPVHIFHVVYIKFLFPEAIILNIVRDPRDVYISFNKMLLAQKKSSRTIAEFSYLWNKAIDIGIKNEVETIRYEDLIKQPRDSINKIIIKYGLFISDLKENEYLNIIQPKEVWKFKAKLNVISDNEGNYKNILSSEEIAEINKNCVKGMTKFCYVNNDNNKRSIIFSFKDKIKWNIIRIYIFKNIIFQACRFW